MTLQEFVIMCDKYSHADNRDFREQFPVQQRTEEWFRLRLGKITGSNFGKVMSGIDKALGKEAVRYARTKALEIAKESSVTAWNYSGWQIERGHAFEPVAIHEYEKRNFCEVTNGGFFLLRKLFGSSPDGLVGRDGFVEVKSVIEPVQWERIESNEIDEKFFWQIHGNLWVTGRSWCDFISFCPEFTDNKKLFVKRIYRDEEIIQKIERRMFEFTKLIVEKLKILES